MTEGVIRVLVVSQHDAVRRQLVGYLSRSPMLDVTGDEFSSESVEQTRPDVLVLDLSQIGAVELRQVTDVVRHSGTRLIALASLRVLADEQAVLEVGGVYRLKSAGADGLADLVTSTDSLPVLSYEASRS